ncbi:Histidine decarboxylase [Glycine soja]|uniref:Histidine decarboxylase n=1 Tax=Glycine soja TaxID=3848 RepID=A0A0B2SNA5_GLYSO|nr:Histidine decarboxylase [Glycine soja]
MNARYLHNQLLDAEIGTMLNEFSNIVVFERPLDEDFFRRRMKCVKISTLTSGEIDCANLRNLVLAHKDKPAIINLNIGTTMKGAIDDLDLVIQTLEGCGFTRDRFYIHCDGALFGMMLPFVKQLVQCWNLACNGNIAHVMVMQHITVKMLDSFVGEFRKKRSFWFEDGQLQPLCIANDIGSRNCACSMHR